MFMLILYMMIFILIIILMNFNIINSLNIFIKIMLAAVTVLIQF